MFQPETEACAGCDAMPPAGRLWAWVAVMRNGPGPFVARPVCGNCWTRPTARKRPLKAHFFARQMATRALELAGSATLGEDNSADNIGGTIGRR